LFPIPSTGHATAKNGNTLNFERERNRKMSMKIPWDNRKRERSIAVVQLAYAHYFFPIKKGTFGD
jgi:hypothetical protein